MKKNMEKIYLNKLFKNNYFIMEIHSMEIINKDYNGLIQNENALCEPIYKILANCTICMPTIGGTVILQVLHAESDLVKS